MSKGQRHNRTGLRRTVFFYKKLESDWCQMDKDIIGRTVLFYKKLESDWCQKDRDIIGLVSKGQYFFYKKIRIGLVSKGQRHNRTGLRRTVLFL